MTKSRRHVYESDPGPLLLAQQQLELLGLTEVHLSRLARRLLSEPQVNADRVGHDPPEPGEACQDNSLEELLAKVAPHGLHLFEAGLDATATFRIAPTDVAPFLRALLSGVSLELARRELARPKRLNAQDAALNDSDPLEELSDDYGIFAPETTGNLYELDSDISSQTDRERAEVLLKDLCHLLRLRSEGSQQRLRQLRQLTELGAHVIETTFPQETDEVLQPLVDAVDETFNRFASNVSTGGRQAYTGMIMSWAGLTIGSSDPSSARERVRKALTRAQSSPQEAPAHR